MLERETMNSRPDSLLHCVYRSLDLSDMFVGCSNVEMNGWEVGFNFAKFIAAVDCSDGEASRVVQLNDLGKALCHSLLTSAGNYLSSCGELDFPGDSVEERIALDKKKSMARMMSH